MNKYHIYEQQAKGKYSVIFKARKKKKLEFVAIKRMEKNRRKKILNEAKILTDISHPNVIRFHDFMETKNHMWSVTEYCPGGDLLKLIEQDKSLPENVVKSFIIEILKGLQFVHSKGIVVCDLKLASILINEYGKIKLADFGSSKTLVDLMHTDNQPKKGTPCYMAPELFYDGGVYSFQSDLWSVGCIMYELAQGNPPFVSATQHEIVNLAQTAQTPKAEFLSSDFNDLLQKLMAKSPSKRISWRQIVQHKWVNRELPNLDIPNQPHLEKSSKAGNQEKAMLRSCQVQEGDEYDSGNQSNPSDRRGQYTFQNDRQDSSFCQVEEERVVFGDQMPVERDFKKKANPTIPKTNRNKIPQIEDSSKLTPFTDIISRSNLLPLSEVISHSSDNSVKPIIGNKDIQLVQSFQFNKKSLGFSYIDPETLAEGIINGQMDAELKKIFDGMTGDQKYNVLGYFQSIIQNSDIANYLFKANFIAFYMKLMKTYKQSSLRAKICEILGFLIRHATVIETDVLKHGIISGLLEAATKDKSQKVRRKGMAALGELLFYGATQVDQKILVWDISSSTIQSLLKILKNQNQDQIVRIYCCKSVENITAQAREVGLKFAQIDTLIVLINCFNTTRNQGFRTSIACTLHHIISLNSSLVEIFIEKVGINNVIDTLKSQQTNVKIVQILLWTYITQFNKTPNSKLSKSIYDDDQLYRAVLGLLEINSPIVRGRVYLYIYFLLQYNIKKVISLPESKLFHIIDKQNKEGSKYEVQCLQYTLVIVFQNYATFIKLCQQDIKASLKGPSLQQDNYRKNQNFINVINHLATSPVFEQIFQNSSNFQQLMNLMNFLDCKQSNTHLETVKSIYMQVVQKILTNNQLTEKLQEYYSNSLLPFLVGKILKSSQNDIRFNCMKFLLFLVSFYMSEDYLYDSTVLSSTSNKIILLINSHLIPEVDFLLQQSQTVSSICLKLLAVLFQISDVFISKFYELGKVKYVLPFYTEHASVNILKIVQYLVKSNLLKKQQLESLIQQTETILAHYVQTGQDIFLEYPLQIYLCFANHNLCTQASIDRIWQLVVPLQGHDDIVVREKSENLIQAFLNQKKTGNRGNWELKEKRGLQNYQKYLKLTGRDSDPKVVAPFQVKSRYK